MSSRAAVWGLELEAALAGLYVSITRSLAPLYLVSRGLGLDELLGLSALGNAAALALLGLLRRVLTRSGAALRRALPTLHGVERALWCSIPFSGPLAPALYASALAVSSSTGLLMTVALLSLGDEELSKQVMARRGALSASTSLGAQLLSVATLAGGGMCTVITLFLVAASTGFAATAVVLLITHRLGGAAGSGGPSGEEPVTIFVFLSLVLSSSAILGVAWTPYLLRVLSAPPWLSASLGLVQTAVSIASPLVWLGRGAAMYRVAVLLLPLAPLAALATPYALGHLALAALYAFVFSGVNYFAGFAYAGLARSLGPVASALFLASASASSQLIGSSLAYAMLRGLGPSSLFLASSVLGGLGGLIAMLAVPRIAVAPERYVRMYSRLVYSTSLAGYSTAVFVAVASLRLALLLSSLMVVALLMFIMLRMAYYISVLSAG